LDYAALIDRIMGEVDAEAYLPYADAVDPEQQEAMSQVQAALSQPGFDPDRVRSLVHSLHANGQIDRVHKLSALHVIAASPRVADFDEAARLVAEQEQAAMSLGGPRLQANLASVERHRGVLAFLQERFGIALDYFSRAFERQRSAGNLSNVLATLLRLGDLHDAQDLLNQVRKGLDPTLVQDLERIIAADPDLALLRTEGSQ
jgi:tetratricopeptide (TPR) repeat protein